MFTITLDPPSLTLTSQISFTMSRMSQTKQAYFSSNPDKKNTVSQCPKPNEQKDKRRHRVAMSQFGQAMFHIEEQITTYVAMSQTKQTVFRAREKQNHVPNVSTVIQHERYTKTLYLRYPKTKQEKDEHNLQLYYNSMSHVPTSQFIFSPHSYVLITYNLIYIEKFPIRRHKW